MHRDLKLKKNLLVLKHILALSTQTSEVLSFGVIAVSFGKNCLCHGNPVKAKNHMKIAFHNFRQINCCLIFHGHDCTITMSRKNNSLSMMNKVSAAMPFQVDQETGLLLADSKTAFFVHVVFVEGCKDRRGLLLRTSHSLQHCSKDSLSFWLILLVLLRNRYRYIHPKMQKKHSKTSLIKQILLVLTWSKDS